MCGLFGFISAEKMKGWTDRKKVMHDMFVMDSLRGMDSAGTFVVPHDKNETVKHFKRAVNGIDFLDLKSMERILRDVDKYAFFVGHNRAATKGVVNNANAHPFEFESGIGVHNGTIRTSNGIDNYHYYDVDSEALIETLLNKGADETIPKINGAFTLVWHNYDEDQLHIVRNSERPLVFIKVKDEETIVFGSEYFMVAAALVRHGKIEEYHWIPDKGVEYIFPANDPLNYTIKQHELYVAPTTTAVHYGGHPGWHRGQQAQPSRKEKRNNQINEKLMEEGFKQGEYIHIVPTDFHHYGNTNRGCVEGLVESPKGDWLNVIIHNVTIEDYRERFEDGWVKGKLTGINAKNNDPFLYVDPASVTVETFHTQDEDVIEGEVEESTKEFVGPKGKVSVTEWWHITQDGCCMCSAPIWDSFNNHLGWSVDGQPICPHCLAEDNDYLPVAVH